ncbi:hypothetical protein FQA39_LY02400 [Lamprigera yunnana]|nr:hypothetical protein FQA39_LY02400 [Lamprigera yunnana]
MWHFHPLQSIQAGKSRASSYLGASDRELEQNCLSRTIQVDAYDRMQFPSDGDPDIKYLCLHILIVRECNVKNWKPILETEARKVETEAGNEVISLPSNRLQMNNQKVVHSQGQKIIYNVYQFMKKEKEEGLTTPLSQLQEPVVEATGCDSPDKSVPGSMGGSKVLFLLVLCTVNAQERYKLCAKPKDIQNCGQIGRDDHINCTFQMHNIDCILDIEYEKSDFGTITPNEALIAAKYVKEIVVLGEFRLEPLQNDDSEFSIVVVTKKNHTGGLKNLRGKKYCHPGFKFDWIDMLLKEFENVVLRENDAEGCSKSGTSIEKEISAISDFFGPSCRPGPWLGVDEYDSEFYTKYSKLCEICSSSQKCNVAESSFIDTLQCLTSGGDVALTTLHSVYQYFNKSENANKVQEFGYLCRNGAVNSLDTPCTWGKQPWNIIVANRKMESQVKKSLQSWLPKYVVGESSASSTVDENIFVTPFKSVFFPQEEEYRIKFYDTPESLLKYMEGYRTIPSVDEKCNDDIKWCTVSDAEQKKCEWLSQASANIGVQPSIKCVQSHNTFACLEDMKNKNVDVVASDAHFGYISRRKNLVPLAYLDTAQRNRIKPIVVIKHSDNSITKFEDLKGKKACFPEYGGIEWLSFINITRDRGILSKASCDYGKLISDFVGDSCMPGAHDKEHETSEIDQDKLCRLCQAHPYISKTESNCNSNVENRFYGSAGALQCLGDGDFAVVTQAEYAEVNSNEYRVLCKNGSLASYSGFNVDDNCILTEIVEGEVLSKKDNPKNGNIRVVLLNLETRFGLHQHKPFEVFNVFNHTLNLLFKDSTQGLTALDSEKKHIKNFADLLSHHEKCVTSTDNSAENLHMAVMPVVLASLSFIVAMH